MALVDFALVVVVLMLSTSIGSETIFLGLPLFFATTSADMLWINSVVLINFDVRTKYAGIFDLARRAGSIERVSMIFSTGSTKFKVSYQLRWTS